MKILIVDDEPAICQGTERRLRQITGTETEIHQAYSPREAEALFSVVDPDLVITDIRMEEYDGLSMLEKMHELRDDFAAIIITAYDQFPYAQQAIRHGVSDFLVKPYTISELRSAITRVTESLKTSEKKQDTEGFEEEYPADGITPEKPENPSDFENNYEYKPGSIAACAIDYIHRHLGSQITMEAVCEEMHVNYSYFSRQFKQQTGKSFSQIVTAEQMSWACARLRENWRVNEIADKLGYQNAESFSKAFVRVYGMSPRNYLQKKEGKK